MANKKPLTNNLAAVAIACLVATCLLLVACGGSSSSSAANSSADSSSAASVTSSAVRPEDRFVGTWKVAAAEMQGITMGGNFGELAGVDSGTGGDIVVNADGTGSLTFGDKSGGFTWAAEDANMFYLTMQSETGATAQQAIQVSYKDDALFVPLEQDGRQMTVIFTKDGNYASARQISLDGAQPITSESALLGTWTLVGMNMGGVSMYGDVQSMSNAMGSAVSTVTFKEGGVVEMDSGTGSWAVSADGASMTSADIMGTNTVPIVMLGDEIALDYSQVFQGQTFIIVMAKA